MSIVYMLLPFIAVLGAMIFVHEFGHFAVAKLLKIRVDVFSLGFGPRLIGFRRGDTDYRVSAIPLGGYVKMKGENLDEELENTGDEFLTRPKWQRFLVLFAGPWMNIVTAVAIPAVMAMIAFQVPAYRTKPALVGSVAQSSAAAQAGIKAGDVIVRIDNKENPTWHDVDIKSEINPSIPIKVVVKRNEELIETTLTPKVRYVTGEKVGSSGLLPNHKQEPVTVGQVVSGAPAGQAGLKPGDIIVGLNGEPVQNFYWFYSSVQNLEGQEISITVERAGARVDLKMTPRREADGNVRVGFGPKEGTVTQLETISTRKPFLEAVKYSLEKNYEILVLTKEALGQIFTGQRKAQDALAGPIQIAKISGQAYQSGGIEQLLYLMALLSLNLGIFNLFPIPVLDGGHIFMLALEGLLGLGGYKLSVTLKEKMLQVGFVLLVLLMGFVIINDISKFFIPKDTPTASQPAQTNQGK
ncbi:MAG: RIP metalloprotease RseP [Acidobacteriota bacterium]